MSAAFCFDATLGLTAFNAEGMVTRAVSSALGQVGVTFEIVIVDDASADGTWSILEELAAAHPGQIRIHRQDVNQGVAAARNRLIDLARGEFLLFFDDDDVSDPGRAAAQIAAIKTYEQTHPSASYTLCHTARRQIYPDGKVITARTLGDVECGLVPAGDDVARAILFGMPVLGGNGAMATCSQGARLSTYRALSGFDKNLRRSEDTDFCLRAARAGAHFIGLQTPYVTQYMTRTADKKITDERRYVQAVFAKHQDFINQHGRGDFDRIWLDVKHDYLTRAHGSFIRRLLWVAARHPLLTLQKISRTRQIKANNQVQRVFYAGGGE